MSILGSKEKLTNLHVFLCTLQNSLRVLLVALVKTRIARSSDLHAALTGQSFQGSLTQGVPPISVDTLQPGSVHFSMAHGMNKVLPCMEYRNIYEIQRGPGVRGWT